MQMWLKKSLALSVLVLFVVMGCSTSILAQEQEDDADASEDTSSETTSSSSRWIGKIYVEASSWIAQPVGLQYVPALEADDFDPFNNEPLELNHGTKNRYRYTAGMRLKNGQGDIFFSWYSHQDRMSDSASTPGVFNFIQQLTPPTVAGYDDRGRSDAYDYDTDAKLRDFRLNFARNAVDSERLKVRWSAGLRRVTFDSEEAASYYALVPPDFPILGDPVSSPRPDLVPSRDTARMDSKYSGRGAEVGAQLRYYIWKNKFSIEADLNIALLRGDVESTYTSTTSYYGYFDAQSNLIEIIEPPYDVFFDPIDPTDPNSPLIVTQVRQIAVPLGIESDLSASSMAIDTSFGIRYNAWKDLDIIAGFRSSRYDEAAYRIRPTEFTLDTAGRPSGFTSTTTSRSIGYEGFYLGLSYLYGK